MGIIAVRRGNNPALVMFRQTGNTLEYSIDSVEWLTAYTFDEVTAAAVNQTATAAAAAQQQTTAAYNGTVSSIAPALSSASTRRKDAALCSASRLFFDYMRSAVLRIDETEGQRDKWEVAAATMGGLAGALGIFGAFPAAVAAGIVAGAAGLIAQSIPDVGHWSDTAALEDALCCFYTTAKAGALSYTDIRNALTPAGGCATGNAALILSNIRAAYDSSADIYTSFLALVNAAASVELAGACPCENYWTHEYNFRASPYTGAVSAINDANGANVLAPWQAGHGYRARTAFNIGRADRGVFINVTFPSLATDLIAADIVFTYTQGGYTSPIITFSLQSELVNVATVTGLSATESTLSIPNGLQTRAISTGTLPDGDRYRFYIRCGYSKDGLEPGGDVTLHALRLYGTGVNPWGV